MKVFFLDLDQDMNLLSLFSSSSPSSPSSPGACWKKADTTKAAKMNKTVKPVYMSIA